MKNIILLGVLAVIFWSCDEPAILNVNNAESKLIIEAQVTNKDGYQYVKLSRSNSFYSTGNSPRVTNAVVKVKDDQGLEVIFVHHADSAGYYFPQTPFTGSIGRTYTLSVDVDGERYEGEDEMFSVTTIDSLSYRINNDEKKDPKDPGKYYEVLLFTKEPQNTVDYYLFKFYRNDSLKVYTDTDIYYSDDKTLAEAIDGITSPIYYAPGDVYKVEAYSLTRKGYVFYNDLQSLITGDGGLFNQPPSNSRTNLTNGALGFFQVSAVNEKEITIGE
jgi:hypothetical protein